MLVPRSHQSESADKAIDHMRRTPEPGVLVLGTAAGKSVVTSLVAHVVAKAGKRVLCLSPNGDLASESAKKYRAIGERCSIFSASLGQKNTGHQVVFATPKSVANALDKFNDEYALLLVDECDSVGEDEETIYQKIISHLISKNPKLRILGMTATPVRGKEKLIGEKKTFKHVIHELPHAALSKLGWTVPYKLGHTHESYDLAKLKADSDGRLKQSDVDERTLNKERLTKSIIADMQKMMAADDRHCAIIFASSVRHANEILSYLPVGEAALVTGKTSKGKNGQREKIIQATRDGFYKYLITVNALGVGTDIQRIDTVAFLMNTGAIRKLIQFLGRGCRLFDLNWPLHPSQMNWLRDEYSGKKSCLVLDYGGNLERFALDDDIIISGLIESKDKQDDDDFFIVECPECGHENRHTSQRCTGITKDDIRCDFRFQFKECPSCETKNSPSARYCRKCEEELLDPARNLTAKAARGPGVPFYVEVLDMSLRRHIKGQESMLRVDYQVSDGDKTWSISEFQKPESGDMYSRKRWHYFSEDVGAMGNTVANVLLEAERLKPPARLLVKKEKGSKYYSVEGRR